VEWNGGDIRLMSGRESNVLVGCAPNSRRVSRTKMLAQKVQQVDGLGVNQKGGVQYRCQLKLMKERTEKRKSIRREFRKGENNAQ